MSHLFIGSGPSEAPLRIRLFKRLALCAGAALFCNNLLARTGIQTTQHAIAIQTNGEYPPSGHSQLLYFYIVLLASTQAVLSPRTLFTTSPLLVLPQLLCFSSISSI